MLWYRRHCLNRAVPYFLFSLLLCIALAGLAVLRPALAQPLQLPGAYAPSARGTPQPAPTPQPISPWGGVQPAANPNAAASRPDDRKARPAPKAGSEASVLDRTLRRHGSSGEARVERIGSGFGLRLVAEGFQIDNLTEPCGVSFGDKPMSLKPLGRPAGIPRYELEASACPIVFDVLDGALLATGPTQPCMIEAAQCRIDPLGLWAPDGRGLVADAQNIERARARAELSVREGYKSLTARASVPDQRMIAREQAGFSSERELICRDFLREGTHGFCAARITEARAAELQQRLAAAGPDKSQAKRPKPKPPTSTAPRPGPPLQLQN
jgi:hypothetical protein